MMCVLVVRVNRGTRFSFIFLDTHFLCLSIDISVDSKYSFHTDCSCFYHDDCVRVGAVTWAMKELTTERTDAEGKFIFAFQGGKGWYIAIQYRAGKKVWLILLKSNRLLLIDNKEVGVTVLKLIRWGVLQSFSLQISYGDLFINFFSSL